MYNILYILFFIPLSATTIQEIYENSGPANGYDKYMELNSNIIYRGGIGIFEGDIYIDCNGAVIDLEDGNGIWIYADEQYPSSLEIKDCSIESADENIPIKIKILEYDARTITMS